MIRAPIPRTFRHGKKKHIGHTVRKRIDVVHRQTHLTSRPTWNDSTGRCSYELTNNIKYLTDEPIGRLFLHLAKRLETAHADDNYFRRQKEPFSRLFSFFFFFFVITLWLQSDHQKPLNNYPNGWWIDCFRW